VVAKANSVGAAPGIALIVELTGADTSNLLAMWVSETSSTFRVTATFGGGASELIAGPAVDLLPHIFEYGALATAEDKFQIDGAGLDGTQTLSVGYEVRTVNLFHAHADNDGWFAGSIGEVIVSKASPSAAAEAAMYEYLALKWDLD
jgi:hypothetical protein